MLAPKEQLDALLKALGVTDFNAASARVTELTSASANATNWQTERTAFFALQDQPGASAAITQFQSERDGLWKTIGVTSYADATAAVERMNGDLNARQSMIDTLTAQSTTLTADVASAREQITKLEASQTDFDGKVKDTVVKEIAKTGMPAPIAKVIEQQNPSASTTRKASHLQRAIALAEQQNKTK